VATITLMVMARAGPGEHGLRKSAKELLRQTIQITNQSKKKNQSLNLLERDWG
jgi:hypothetical protein